MLIIVVLFVHCTLVLTFLRALENNNYNKSLQGIDTINILNYLGITVNKILILVVSGYLSLTSLCSAEAVVGIDLDEVVTLSTGGAELRLKGAVIKSNARQAVYVGGLYLQNGAGSVDEIIDNVGEKRFLIRTNQSIKADALIRGINLGITVNHSEEELIQLKPFVEQFNEIWRTKIKQGDEICIDYDPKKGTVVSVNGEQKGVISGQLFYSAFLKTWIGERPLNATIKKQLLGKK